MSSNHTPVSRARNLRRKMTDEEKKLWQKLRRRKFHGLKFLRQHPLFYEMIDNEPKYFIPDFYCAEKRLIIEIDGKIHEFQKRKDMEREEILSGMGMKIVRFKNEEIEANVFAVLKKIEEFITA